MYNLVRLYAFLFMLTFSALSARSPQYEDLRVNRVEVVVSGARAQDSALLAQTIQTRMKTKSGEAFSQTAFDTDLKMLVQDYDRIDPTIEIVNGEVIIRLTIWENPTICSIRWEGNTRVRSAKLQSELGIAVGSIYDRQKFNTAFHNIKTYYVKKGFFEASLDYTVIHNEAANQVDIVITVNEGRAGKIKKVVFNNFTQAEENCLLEMMVTKRYNFFMSWLSGTGIYNDEMIQHDESQILNYLQNQGYADARVTVQVNEAPQKDRIIICITADKGNRYYFDDVTIEGNCLYSTELLMGGLLFKKGDPYSPDKIHNSIRILSNHYGRRGHIEAFVNYIPTLSDDGCSYKIRIHIEEGDEYRVGMIKIMGNHCTQTKVILHETLLIPGEVFNQDKLLLTERRLCNIGYFKNVNVYAVKSESGGLLPGCYRDVHIEVEETSTGSLGASLGFSSAENIFGSVNVTECNFNIKGLPYVFNKGLSVLRGGGEYAHLSISIGAKSVKYGLSWTKPYFLDTPWSVGFDLDRSITEYISDKYDIRAVGLSLHATYECNAFMRVGTHYRIRYTHVDAKEIKCNDNGSEMSEESYSEAEASDGLISGLGYSWQYNTTNHPICPTKGLKSSAQFEVVGLGGDAHFLSFAYLNSWYYDLGGKALLKIRGDMRFIQPMRGQNVDTIPLDERFFLGGDNMIRGYRSYRLGPKYDKIPCPPTKPKPTNDSGTNQTNGDTTQTNTEEVVDNEDPKGGISMQLFSMELSKPIFSCADVFAFFDAGALSSRRWNFGRYNFSAGVGARLQVFGNGSPPLMVGYGWPLNPQSSSDVKRFFITVGGKF